MEKKSNEVGYSVVLKSGKKVLLREPKISHRNLAAQAVGSSAGDQQFVFAIMMSQEMLRQLIYAIDEKPVNLRDRSELDLHFTPKEYIQLEKVYKMIAGEDEEGGSPLAPKLEIVTIGSK